MPIHYEQQGHIVTITIDRYERRNAFDVEHSVAMIDAWERFNDDPDAWVAIVTGVKDAFCAGGDLHTMSQIAKERIENDGLSPTLDLITRNGTRYFTLKGFEIYKPIIAAVNGQCWAGGMEMLGGTDIRIASRDAVFNVSEPKRGLFAGGGTTARLPRQLAWPAAMEMLLVARPTSAERALQLGLINEVCERDELMDVAMSWAEEICKNAPLSVQATKKSALRSVAVATLEEAYAIEDALSNEVFQSEDAKEGPRAFFEKRDPVWKGR
jgi:enoyl-CoA hydratase